MESPRVVIVGPWWRPLPPVRDGAPEWVIEHTARRMQQWRPLLVSPWHPDLRAATWNPERYLHVHPGRAARWAGAAAARLPHRLARRCFGSGDPAAVRYLWGLERTLRALRPEIVVAHVLPPLCRAARRAAPRARIVHYSHTNDLSAMPEAEWRRFLAGIDGLITVCRTALEAVETRFGPLPIPARAIPNGVDLEAFHPENRQRWRAEARAAFGLGPGPVAVFCGRLHPRKGADRLLHAFRQARAVVPGAQLLLLGASTHMEGGADPYTRSLAALAEACGNVRLAGYVPAPQLGRALAAADVGVLPSVEQEGLPLSILEFAACGMPVVATRVGGVAEAIRDGKEGYLVPPERIDEALAAPLARLLADASLRERMGRAARARMEAAFSWERVARDFETTLGEFQTRWRGEADVRHHRRLYARA